MARRIALTGVAVLAAMFTAGCGGPPKLNSQESYNVASYEEAFATTVVDGGEYGKTLRGVDYLISLCRKKPSALYDKRTMREVVEDGANTLHEYHPDLADQLDRVARNGCK